MLKITKRKDLPLANVVAIKLTSILLGLGLLGIALSIMGHSPIKVYSELVLGALGSTYRIIETINVMIPLTITALGVLIAFKMKFWNIGAEGQIAMGAIAGSYLALFHNYLPKPILLVGMVMLAMLAGGIWALIPAYFKVKYNSNETLFTLMMNYLALQLIVFLQFSAWKDPKSFGFAKIAQFDANAIFPKLLGVHIGWLVMLFLVVAVYMLINHTKLGYEICVVGTSKNTAKYAGMDVKATILKTLFVSGAIAGLVGIFQASAINGTLSVQVSGGYGFTAIIIAWLSGMSTVVVPITAFFFAILTQGANYIQTVFQIPQAVAEVMQAVILIFALGSEFFVSYQLEWHRGGLRR